MQPRDKQRVVKAIIRLFQRSFFQKELFPSQNGQTLLIVVLVMVIALTVGLSAVLRSIISVRTSTEDQSSQRALSAAEAGIEKLSKQTSGSISGLVIGDPSTQIKTATVANFTSDTFVLNGGLPVLRNEGVDVWFSNPPTYSGATKAPLFFIAWDPGKTFSASDCASSDTSKLPAALEVIVISGTSPSNPFATRYGWDPCVVRESANGFDHPYYGTVTVAGTNFPWRTYAAGGATPNVNTNPTFFVRIIPLYNNAIIGISTCQPSNATGPETGPCTPLPTQGKIIQSTGVSGGTERKIVLFQPFPKVPSEFLQYLLFVPKP